MLFIGYRWLDDRIAIRDVFDDVGSKYVPPHVNISIGFGTLPCVWPSLASLGRYTDRLMHVPEVSRSRSRTCSSIAVNDVAFTESHEDLSPKASSRAFFMAAISLTPSKTEVRVAVYMSASQMRTGHNRLSMNPQRPMSRLR